MPSTYHLSNTKKRIPEEIVEKINSLRLAGNPYAAFDLDNTLLIGDIGEAVFALLVKKKSVKNFTWKDYRAMIEKNKLRAYKHIIDAMQGLKLSRLEGATLEVINRKEPISLEGVKIAVPKPSPVMKLILKILWEKGIPIYVVTASNEVSAKIICEKYFGIPASHIIGAEVAVGKEGIIQVGKKEFPFAKGKVNILKKRFKNKPLVTGGDSPGDKYLIKYTSKHGLGLWLGDKSESL